MSGGIYEVDGSLYCGDGREVDPSPSTTEEFRDGCLQRVAEIAAAYRKATDAG